jgi:hypothetical protein
MRLGLRKALGTARAAARGYLIEAGGNGPSAAGPRKVFVVGSGRSGTHWLGYILESFPSAHVTIEKEPIFSWVVEMAQNPAREPELFPKLAQRYRAEHRMVLPKHYVDKSHPNLWLAESLADEFPEALFVAIWRTLEATVASMLKHDGVRHWVEAWDGGVNRFLGVDEAMVDVYRELSVAGRCAVRVVAHAREIERLQGVLGSRLLVVNYEHLFAQPRLEARRLALLLGLRDPVDMPMPNETSRTKWRTQLSTADQKDICRVAWQLGADHMLDSAPAA